MKNFMTFFFLTALVIMMSSCEEKVKENTDALSPIVETTSAQEITVQDTISPADFAKWRANWQKGVSQWMLQNNLYAFNFPVADLRQVMGERPYKTRFYLGLKHMTGEKADFGTPGNYVPKLMVVGIDEGKNNLIDYNEGLYVYDVSNPCPPFCETGGGPDM